MARNESDARIRLRDAALALFRANGYERTTAAEIAAHAGVTERTFFRHFPDKREVLFDGEAVVSAAMVAAIADAPAGLGPLDTLLRAFRVFAPVLEDNRAYSRPRQDVIATTPALRERELAKIDALAGTLAAALRARGVAEPRATIAAHTGMVAFVHATLAWLDDPAISMPARLDAAGDELRALLA